MKKPKRTTRTTALDAANGLGKVVAKYVCRKPVPADALPGELIKLPPMKWPPTLPVEVPVFRTGYNPGYYCISSADNFTGFQTAYHFVCDFVWVICGKGTDSKERLQSAWDETLIRLGYTEDA